MIRDRSFEQNIITFISMPQTATAANGDSRRLLSIYLYILKYFQIHLAHNSLWIYPKIYHFFISFFLLTINSIIYRDIRKPLKFPV